MYELNGIKMFSTDDIKTAFHVSKETAYKLIKSKNAKTILLRIRKELKNFLKEGGLYE